MSTNHAGSDEEAAVPEIAISDRSDLIEPKEERPVSLDRTRAWLAFALLGLFAVQVLVALAVAAFAPASSDAILQVLDKVITPTVGLVGAVSAFYYAREHR